MLNYIVEFFEYEYDKKKKALHKKMSKKKVHHSERVANLVKTLSDSDDVYGAALYHDYIEAGGSMEKTSKILSHYAFKLVLTLTKNEGEGTLNSLKNKLSMYNQKFINDIIKIKICDRFDNLRKKHKNHELDEKYVKKSIILIQFLYDKYIGDDKSNIDKFIENNIYSIPGMKISLN